MSITVSDREGRASPRCQTDRHQIGMTDRHHGNPQFDATSEPIHTALPGRKMADHTAHFVWCRTRERRRFGNRGSFARRFRLRRGLHLHDFRYVGSFDYILINSKPPLNRVGRNYRPLLKNDAVFDFLTDFETGSRTNGLGRHSLSLPRTGTARLYLGMLDGRSDAGGVAHTYSNLGQVARTYN
jgi:hypothetical protein